MKKIISLLLICALMLTFAPTVFAASKGDVNGDGNVTSGDALLVLQYSVGQLKKIDKAKADVNKDGSINSSDALMILQICVGIIGNFDMPKTSQEIVELYNKAIKSTYGKDKMTLKYTYTDSGTISDLTSGKNTPYNDKTSKTVECGNGKYNTNGMKIETFNPGYNLDYRGVGSASINDVGNGKYTIKITLKEEKTDIKKIATYNGQVLPSVYTDEATSGTATYTGTSLVLTIDSNADATALTVKMPYVCEYKTNVSGKSHSMKDVGSVDYTATYTF